MQSLETWLCPNHMLNLCTCQSPTDLPTVVHTLPGRSSWRCCPRPARGRCCAHRPRSQGNRHTHSSSEVWSCATDPQAATVARRPPEAVSCIAMVIQTLGFHGLGTFGHRVLSAGLWSPTYAPCQCFVSVGVCTAGGGKHHRCPMRLSKEHYLRTVGMVLQCCGLPQWGCGGFWGLLT